MVQLLLMLHGAAAGSGVNEAAAIGSVDMFKVLISCPGATVTQNDMDWALQKAVKGLHFRMVELLLRGFGGVKANIQDPPVSSHAKHRRGGAPSTPP